MALSVRPSVFPTVRPVRPLSDNRLRQFIETWYAYTYTSENAARQIS